MQNIAKSFTSLSRELLGMGDSYEEMVESCCYTAGILFNSYDAIDMAGTEGYEDCVDKEDVLDKMFLKAYTILLQKEPKVIEDVIEHWITDGDFEQLRENFAVELVDNIGDSDTFKNLVNVLDYSKTAQLSSEVINELEEYVASLKAIDMVAVRKAREVVHAYLPKLSKAFGVWTNDKSTVGYIISPRDIEEFPCLQGYSYVFFKDVNQCGAPRTELAFLVKAEDGKLIINIRMARKGYVVSNETVGGIVDYIYEFDTLSFNLDTPIDNIAQRLADRADELAFAMYDIATVNPSLWSLLPFNASPEVIKETTHIEDDKMLIDLMVRRAVRHAQLESTKDFSVEKDGFVDAENFELVYTDGREKLYVSYNGDSFVAKWLDKNGDTIDEESATLKGKFNTGYPVACSVLGKLSIRK